MTKTASAPTKGKAIFALDTNVLIHDPLALFNFDEHDVCIPFTVVEELDRLKSGDRAARHEARTVSRIIRQLIEKNDALGGKAEDGIPLSLVDAGAACSGKLYFPKMNSDTALTQVHTGQVNDNLIVKSVLDLKMDTRFEGYRIVLVSKDNNVFIKCRVLGVSCEDYTTDRVENEYDAIRGAKHEFGPEFWEDPKMQVTNTRVGNIERFELRNVHLSVRVNELIVINHDRQPLNGIIREAGDDYVIFDTLEQYTNGKNLFGIKAKGLEQNFAMNVLLDPTIDLIALTGKAGTGKTLLALAAGFHSMFIDEESDQIIATRALIPLGEEMGFLPGDEREKVLPWMGAITDNIEVISPEGAVPSVKSTKTRGELIDAVQLKSINYMRGRTFQNKFIILDEAQNLTPRQLKALVSRAGNGTKVVLLGNTAQIDNPYLTAETSGLTVLIDRFRGEKNFARMHLNGVERSTLAEQADRLL